ncbi:hypothetical protein DPMN_013037 [Dreissena polymorpha]|uniref:Uncharacterized protein n=1 Tax=Dreissena polymorpha TaxID=45954 RepID=A0A9D4S212_DREPO|nr:hypothetical protein DPMN_013037 [Dreissena polymorpha]
MQSQDILKNTAEFANFYDKYDTFRPWFYHYVPYVGTWLQVRNYQYQCTEELIVLLKMCSSEAERLSSHLEKKLKK